MRTDADMHTGGSRVAVGAVLVLSLVASVVLAVAAPLLLSGGFAWVAAAAAIVVALAMGVVAAIFADQVLTHPAKPTQASLELAA